MIGALIMGRVSRRIGIGPTYVVAHLFPRRWCSFRSGGPRWLVLTCLFPADLFSGLGVMLLDISSLSIMAAVDPRPAVGAVVGAYMVVNYGVRPLGGSSGRAASAIGVRTTP